MTTKILTKKVSDKKWRAYLDTNVKAWEDGVSERAAIGNMIIRLQRDGNIVRCVGKDWLVEFTIKNGR